MRLACRVLPGGRIRDRYRREFTAELCEMTPGQQTVHALQILISVWSLRMAVAGQRGTVTTTPTATRRHPLRCRLNVFHTWTTESTEDGQRFQTCRRCGEDRHDVPGHDHGYWAAAAPNAGM